jgi:hypothetical protein
MIEAATTACAESSVILPRIISGEDCCAPSDVDAAAKTTANIDLKFINS